MTKIKKSPLKHEGMHSPYVDEIAYHKAQGGVHEGIDYGEGTVYKRKSKEEQEKIDKNIEEQKVKEQEENPEISKPEQKEEYVTNEIFNDPEVEKLPSDQSGYANLEAMVNAHLEPWVKTGKYNEDELALVKKKLTSDFADKFEFATPIDTYKGYNPLVIDGEEVDLDDPLGLGLTNPMTDLSKTSDMYNRYNILTQQDLHNKGYMQDQNGNWKPYNDYNLVDGEFVPSWEYSPEIPENYKNDDGNYAYDLNTDEYTGQVEHMQDWNGAIDWDTFRQIAGKPKGNVERYFKRQLNNMHNLYRKNVLTNDNNPEGLDKNGSIIEFDFKAEAFNREDQLIMYRKDKYGNVLDSKVVLLPTEESTNTTQMWNKVYQDYVSFVNGGNKSDESKSLEMIGQNWDTWANMVIQKSQSAIGFKPTEIKHIEQYLEMIEGNKEEIVSGGGVLQSRYSENGVWKIKPGDSRGGIQRVTHYMPKYEITYWTIDRNHDLTVSQGSLDSEDYRYFQWKGKTHAYAAESGFKPPKYDEDGRLIDGGDIQKWENYKYMQQDYERGKKNIEDIFHEDQETTDIIHRIQGGSTSDMYKTQYINLPVLHGGTAIITLPGNWKELVGKGEAGYLKEGAHFNRDKEVDQGKLGEEHRGKVWVWTNGKFAIATPKYDQESVDLFVEKFKNGEILTNKKYWNQNDFELQPWIKKNKRELREKYKDNEEIVATAAQTTNNSGIDTGVEEIVRGVDVVVPEETEESYEDVLNDVKQEQKKDIYANTEIYQDNITPKDIMNYQMNIQKDVLDSDAYVQESFELQKDFEEDFAIGLEKILEPYKEEIESTIETEFKEERKQIQNQIDELIASYDTEDDMKMEEIINIVQEELNKDIKNGSFDPKSDSDYIEEYKKRVIQQFNNYVAPIKEKRLQAIKNIEEPFHEKYNKRLLELNNEYAGDYIDSETKKLEKAFYEHQANFIKRSYETKSNGAEQLIPDVIYDDIFKKLQEDGIHAYGYEGQKEHVNLAWRKLELSLKTQGLTEDEINARREEFYYKAFTKISLDKSGAPTGTGIKLLAEDIIDELSKEDDLTEDEEERLRYAKKIIESPEFMSKYGIERYFDGMFSRDLGDLIPIYNGIKEGNHNNYIRKLLKKPAKDLTEGEKETLIMWNEHKKLEASLAEKSSSYNAGRGTVDSFRFMLEMIATRGLGKFLGKGTMALTSGKRVKLLNRSQATLDRYAKIHNMSSKTLKIQQKAANTQMFLLSTSFQATLGGSGNIYEQTMENMTPEMVWSLTSDGEQIVAEIDKLGFYVGDDENGNPIYEQDKGWDEAFINAFGHNWIEYGTEKFGQYIPGMGKHLRKELAGDPMWMKRMFLGRWARKMGYNPASADFMDKVLRHGGWNGVVPEVMEEFIAQPFHNLIDGRGLLDGIDKDFTEEVLIQTSAMQLMFGAANRTYKFATGKKDPVYIVGNDSYATAEDALKAISYAKDNNNLKDLKIEINNDYYAFEEAYNLLEGTGFENNLDSKNLEAIIEDVTKSIEVEAIDKLSKKQVEEVEKISEEIDNLESKKESLSKNSGKDKKKALEEIYKVDLEINKLDNRKKEILKPVIESINKERSSETYKEQVETVRKFEEEVDANTNIIEVESTQETAEFYREMAINDMLRPENIEVIRDARTGKRVFVDTKNNTTLSNKDLLERNIDINAIDQQIEKDANEFDMTHGFTTPEVNGRQSIIVNKEASLKLGAKNVFAHEFLHRFLNKTFNKNPHVKLAVGRALRRELENMNPKDIRNSNFRNRIIDYQNRQGEIRSAEETLNLFSDALVSGEIKYNESTFTKIGDMFRRVFSLAGKRVEFESGRDVMNFVRDYNRMIETKRMSRGMRRTMQQGARVRGEIKYGSDMYAKELKRLGFKRDTEGRFPMLSKEASDKVQSIYEEQGVGGAFDIIDAFKPITGKIVEKRRDVPGFDRQLLMDEIETGARGIFDLIQSYNPDSGVPLAAYINKYLPSRAIEASNRILGEQFTEDITERVDIAEEAAPVEIFDQVTGKKIKLSERLGPKAVAINKEVKSIAAGMDVSELTFKTLKDLTPDMTQDMFGIIPKPGNLTKGDIKNAQMFINKHAATLIQMLPEGSTVGGTSTGVQKVLLDAFYTKSDRAKMAKTGTKAGLAIQVKNPNIETKQFLEVFGITERGKENTYKKDSNTSSRIKALVSQTGKMLSNQGVREHLLEREKSLDAIQRIADGKSRIMFSVEAKRNFNLAEKVIESETIRSEFDLGIKGIDELSTLYGQGKTYHFRTKANIDEFYREVENIWVPTLPKSLITKGVLRPSRRILPNKGESIIKVNGKEMTIDQYYTMKRDKLLAKDLKYGKDFTGAAKNFKPRVYGKYLGETPGKINESSKSGKIKEFNKINSSMHKQLWQRINKSIRSNPKNIRVWGNYFKLVGQLSTHPHRLGAEMIGWSPKPIGKIVKGKRRLYEWEHAMPATSAYLYLLDASLSGGNFDVSYDLVMKNFKLIALDAGADLKLKSANLTTGMPKGWDLIENSW